MNDSYHFNLKSEGQEYHFFKGIAIDKIKQINEAENLQALPD